jgi:hypothetical protein
VTSGTALAEHAPRNAMEEAGEVEAFYERCSPLMRAAQARAVRALAAVDRP